MHAETMGAVAHRRVMEAEAGGAAQRVLRVQVEVAQLTPKQQDTLRQGCLCVCVCVKADLSQLKPSTLSLQRHCPVLTSHS